MERAIPELDLTPAESTDSPDFHARQMAPAVKQLLKELETLTDTRSRYMAEPNSQTFGMREVGEGLQSKDMMLSPEAERTLEVVMQYFLWQYGELIGVKLEDRHHLNIGDIDYDTLFKILGESMPEIYQEVGMFVANEMIRGRLIGVVFGNWKCLKNPEKLQAARAEGSRSRPQDIYLNWEEKAPLDGRLRSIAKAWYVEGKRDTSRGGPALCILSTTPLTRYNESGVQFQRAGHGLKQGEHGRVQVDKMPLGVNRDEYGDVVIGIERGVEPPIDWVGAFVYQSELDLVHQLVQRSRLIRCSGKIEKSALINTVLTVDGSFEGHGLEVSGGRLELMGSQVNLTAAFFYGTSIDAHRLNTDGKKVFDLCDFTYAKLDDTSLVKVATASKGNCIFSAAQLDRLRKVQNPRLDLTIFSSDREWGDKLHQVTAADEAHMIGGAESPIRAAAQPLSADQLDPDRVDIKRAPMLENAGILKDHREGPSLRKYFPSIGGAEAGKLPKRIDFFQQLVAFVTRMREGKQPLFEARCAAISASDNGRIDEWKVKQKAAPLQRITMEEWLTFLIEEIGPDACEVLGLGEGLLQLPTSLDLVPEIGDNSATSYARESFRVVSELCEGQTGELLTNSSLAFSTLATVPTEYMSGYRGKGPRRRLTNHARLKIVRRNLRRMFGELENYADYLMTLLDKHGYEWPEVDPSEDAVLSLEGIVHPNLGLKAPERREISATEYDPEAVVDGNSLEINTNRDNVIILTGPNKVAGKSTTTSAVMQAIGQAQSGAPCRGKVVLPGQALFDAEFYLEKTMPEAGGGQSGAEQRGEKIRALRQNVRAAAGTPENPTRVLIVLDEIMMGTTDSRKTVKIEYNLVRKLMEQEGVIVTIMVIAPDRRVSLSLGKKFGDAVTFMQPETDGSHHFIETNVPGVSDPRHVFVGADLEDLLEDDPNIVYQDDDLLEEVA